MPPLSRWLVEVRCPFWSRRSPLTLWEVRAPDAWSPTAWLPRGWPVPRCLAPWLLLPPLPLLPLLPLPWAFSPPIWWWSPNACGRAWSGGCRCPCSWRLACPGLPKLTGGARVSWSLRVSGVHCCGCAAWVICPEAVCPPCPCPACTAGVLAWVMCIFHAGAGVEERVVSGLACLRTTLRPWVLCPWGGDRLCLPDSRLKLTPWRGCLG